MASQNDKDIIPMKKALLIIFSVILIFVSPIVAAIVYLFSDSQPLTVNTSTNRAVARTYEEYTTDVADFLNGVWVIESPNNNGETISITFFGNSYTTITEMILIAEYDYILSELDHMEAFYGSTIVVESVDDESTMIQITTNGIFSFTENEISFINTAGETRVLPFSHTENVITIDDDIFIRQ